MKPEDFLKDTEDSIASEDSVIEIKKGKLPVKD